MPSQKAFGQMDIWNQHAKEGGNEALNMEPKRRTSRWRQRQAKLARQKSIHHIGARLSPHGEAPRRPEGQGRLSRPPPGPGPESPAQPLLCAEEEGAWRPHRPEPRLGEPKARPAREPPSSGRELKGGVRSTTRRNPSMGKNTGCFYGFTRLSASRPILATSLGNGM